ncbi:MAG: MFS transporter [Phycisphaerae bacterium]|jgi:UMF1 family MFS transporter
MNPDSKPSAGAGAHPVSATVREKAAAGRRGFLWKLGLHRPELRAWAMYDWANSAFVTTIMTAVFPIYYAKVAGEGLPPGAAESRFTLSTTLGLAFIAVLSPLLGAVADFLPIKKRLVAVFLGIGLISVSLMYFIGPGDLLLASVLFIISSVAVNGSFVFYDAMLPHIAGEDEMDRVSTAGYALGYVGGGVLLALQLAWITRPAAFGLAEGTLPARLAFLSVAVWWGLFSIPLFRRVPEPKIMLAARQESLSKLIRASFGQLGATLGELRRYRDAFVMLLAFLVYNDGIGTIYRMATTYGYRIGIGESDLILAIMVTQFVGVPCAFLFGMLAARIGARTSIFLALAVYTGISIGGFYMTTARHFLLLALGVGMVQGGAQALSRSLFASMIPRSQSGQFFGFFAVIEKFAGIMGPFVWWLVLQISGPSRLPILSVIGFFVIGGVLLSFVNVPRGQQAAREAEAGMSS